MLLSPILAACLLSLSFIIGTAEAKSITLVAAGDDYSLISPGAGEKSLRVTVCVPDGRFTAGKLKAEVRAFGISVERLPKVIASSEASLSWDRAGCREIPLKINFPNLGYYEITLSVTDSAGNVVASTAVPYAVVPPRQAAGPSDFGVCTHIAGGGPEKAAFITKNLDLLRLAGFSRVRNDFFWNRFEKKAGVYTFEPGYDEFVKQAHDRDLKPLAILAYSNGTVYPMRGFPDQPESRAAFAKYAAELVKRYGQTINDWEVWNEPHSWGKPTFENYTLLLKETYQAIKAVSPAARVISCGGGGAGGGPSGEYISGVIKFGGLNYQDGFSIHPYVTPPATPDTGYGSPDSPVRRVCIPMVWEYLGNYISNEKNRKSNGKPLEMWVTEFGCFSSPVPMVQGEPFQALFVSRSFLLSRRYGTAKALFWYDFKDDGTNSQNKEHNFGLIHNDYSPKPSYVATAVLTWTLGERPWKKIILENADVTVNQFGEDAGPVFVGWTPQHLKMERATIRIKPGVYRLRDWQGTEKEIEIGEEGYHWKLGPLPQYLIPKTVGF